MTVRPIDDPNRHSGVIYKPFSGFCAYQLSQLSMIYKSIVLAVLHCIFFTLGHYSHFQTACGIVEVGKILVGNDA